MRCRRFRFDRPGRYMTLRVRANGPVMFHSRRVEDIAVERINGGVGLLLGLSLNRRSKCGKGKAQDCKTLHRSSPFFMWVHSADLFSRFVPLASELPIGASGLFGTSQVLSRRRLAASEFSDGRQGKLP